MKKSSPYKTTEPLRNIARTRLRKLAQSVIATEGEDEASGSYSRVFIGGNKTNQ
jgi:hypothetical protein